MRGRPTLIAFILITIVIFSCKKDKGANTDCFSNAITVRKITNAQATVKASGGKFYLVEQGTIDTKLNPCTLAPAFQIDNLQVTISGDVKMTDYAAGEPCCTNNFLVTQITR